MLGNSALEVVGASDLVHIACIASDGTVDGAQHRKRCEVRPRADLLLTSIGFWSGACPSGGNGEVSSVLSELCLKRIGGRSHEELWCARPNGYHTHYHE